MPEIREVDPDTGGEKGRKSEEFAYLDPVALQEVARVAGYGSKKYAPFNYLKGYKWSLSYSAGQRHLNEMWAGEDIDPESELYHAAHAAWHCLALVSFQIRGLGTDDRPPSS